MTDARWDFQVLLPLFDPPRHDTKETIENCIAKGIQVKMVTGDQLLIGKETAKQLGMGTNMYTTEVLLNVSTFLKLYIARSHANLMPRSYFSPSTRGQH